MSYQVLARKWRPQQFAEMVGQRHVLKALVNALDNQRLHHAYLFTGTRGVGKTTLARLFAKSLNCEQGVSATPCGRCSSCVEVTENRFIDLIEVDAASRTKVEDTRELLENVQYAPTRGRYKVYLIDEVHMLSNHSFNALLKTLEEPPPHVKFLLATTDPQKLPVTVLSRCLQFNLKSMTSEMVVDHLRDILQKEQVNFEDSALLHLGKAAQGSMRDALSLTDQAVAYGQGAIRETEVAEMLGTVDTRQIVALLTALCEQDAEKMLQQVSRLGEFSPDWQQLMADVLALLHQLTVLQLVPDYQLPAHQQALSDLAARFAAEDVQLYYQLGLQAHRDLESAPEARQGFEMALLRMLAFTPDFPRTPRRHMPTNEPSEQASRTTDTAAVRQGSVPPPATGAGTVHDPEPEPESVPQSESEGGMSSDLETDLAVDREVPVLSQPEPVPAAQPEPATALESEALPVATQSRQTDASAKPDTVVLPPWEPEPAPAESVSESCETVATVADRSAGEPLPSNADIDSPDLGSIEPGNSAAALLDSAVVTPSATATAQVQDQTDTGFGADTQKALDTASSDPDALGDLWLDLIPALELTGVMANLIHHSAVRDWASAELHLVIEPDYERLYQPAYAERLQEALVALGIEVSAVQVSFDTPGEETFAQRANRRRREAYQVARAALEQDVVVQALTAQLGGELLPDTVEPLDQERTAT